MESNTISGIQGGGKKVTYNSDLFALSRMVLNVLLHFPVCLHHLFTGCEVEGEVYLRVLLGGAGGHLQELQNPVRFHSIGTA